MTSYSFDYIMDLCRDEDITESEVIHQLKSILHGNTDVLNEKDEDGHTLLHGAVVRRFIELIKLLVLLLIDVHRNTLRVGDSLGDLPLHLACLEGKCDVVNFILERDVYGVSRTNADGKPHSCTPISC
jgi:ankyrin repeat protein